jgi:hypothetical protein
MAKNKYATVQTFWRKVSTPDFKTYRLLKYETGRTKGFVLKECAVVGPYIKLEMQKLK